MLPTDPARVEFGAARDRFDLSKGWTLLEIPEPGSKQAKKGVVNDSPMGAGLRDGAALAVRFRGEDEDEDMGEEEGEWDVVVPGYDD